MNNLKKCQVVMLSTNEKAEIGQICINNVQMFKWTEKHNEIAYKLIEYKHIQPQHLYFLSDEEIKEGDWFITIGDIKGKESYNFSTTNKCIRKEAFTTTEGERERLFISETGHFNGYNPKGDIYFKKIIATTDKSLTINYDGTTPISKDWNGKLLPQPSPQFITKFIEEWNKGNKIEWVNVEYEEYGEELGCDPAYYGLPSHRLKVDKNNCITITKVKDSWSREEVESLLYKYAEEEHAWFSSKSEIESFNEWIEENL